MSSIDDLHDHEFTQCLNEVDDYVRKNVCLQKKGKQGENNVAAAGGFIERDQGPGAASDRSTMLIEYNGFSGGRVFKWYTRPVFERHLRKRGWKGLPRKVEQCTEQECMIALRATSDELQMFPMLTSHMLPYSGPQCFPHLRDAVRRNANAHRQIEDGALSADNAHGFTGVWRRCDEESCRRWRHIDSKCCFAMEHTQMLVQGPCHTDWLQWFNCASERYAAAMHRHRTLHQSDDFDAPRSDQGGHSGEEEWDAEAGAGASSIVDPAVVDHGSSDTESVGVSEDDVERPGVDCQADDWTSVLKGLGACGGGMSEKDLRAQQKLVSALPGAEQDKSHLRPGSDCSPLGQTRFTCSMLQGMSSVEGGNRDAEWQNLTCGDTDDFTRLVSRKFCLSDVHVGDRVLIIEHGALVPPTSDGDLTGTEKLFGAAVRSMRQWHLPL